MMRKTLACFIGITFLGVLAPMQVRAADSAPSAGVSPQLKANADEHFRRGQKHFEQGEFREAYDAMMKSYDIHQTAKALSNGASCLKELGRYDDALDMYERVLLEFPSLSLPFRQLVGKQIEELQAKVGPLVISGDMPKGAELFVDGRSRGTLPSNTALRLSVGPHEILARIPGFDDVRVSVEVSAGKENTAFLRGTSKLARLRIVEKHNWVLMVELNGKDVGLTPWSGMVEAGEHKVRLHGLVGLATLEQCALPEAQDGVPLEMANRGAKVSSGVESKVLRAYETAELLLGAEELDTSLRVDSNPSGATLLIDSKVVGMTPWEGRLELGPHEVEVSQAGFLTAKQTVRLVRRKQQELTLVMEKVRPRGREDFWNARTIGAGAAYGVGLLGLGLGAVMGGIAMSEVGGIRARCGGPTCTAVEAENIERAQGLGTVATAGFAAGVAGAVGGTAILIFGGSNREKAVGIRGLGVGGRF